jgi:phospholipid/cholesterol/gamma-HCH transport system permease protein
MDMLARIGKSTTDRLREGFYFLGYSFNVLKETVLFFGKGQVGYKVLVMQILFTGVEALGISAAIAIGIGAAINVIASSLLPAFGQGQLTYVILIMVITRELGPLLTAFVIIARSGTAIATEIGTMVVSHEIEAYVSVGVNPISYLAVPRFVGVTVSIVILNIYFNLFGLLGSFLVVQFIRPLPVLDYVQGILAALKPEDLMAGFAKSVAFGMIVSLVSTYQGFAVQRASTEVPIAGIRAVGQCLLYCIAANAVITVLYYV